MTRHPAPSMAALIAGCLWGARLSKTTTWPGRSSGTRTCWMNARKTAPSVAALREIAHRGERVRIHLRVGVELHAFDDPPHPGHAVAKKIAPRILAPRHRI